jgi:uncharacterized protein (TIGR03067 family)
MYTAIYLTMALGLFAAQNPAQKAEHADHEHLQGTWRAVSAHDFGREVSQEELRSLRLTIRGDTIHATYGNKTADATFKLNPTSTPQQIDVTLTQGPEEAKGKTFHGIYLLEGDTLKIAYRNPGEPRPKELVTEGQSDVRKVFFRREKE